MFLETYKELNTFRTEFQWIHAATITPLCQAICQTLIQITSLMPHEVMFSVEVSCFPITLKTEIQNKHFNCLSLYQQPHVFTCSHVSMGSQSCSAHKNVWEGFLSITMRFEHESPIENLSYNKYLT